MPDLGLGLTVTKPHLSGGTDEPSGQPFTNLRSVSFDGTDEYMGSLPINRLNGASWSTSTPVSQSAWVKSNSFSVDDAVFGIGQYTVGGLFNASKAGGNSGIHQLASGYYLWLSGTQHNLTGTFSTGVWYHIAWTWDGTNGVIYVNGVQNRTFTDNSNGYAVRFSIWAGGGGRWNAYSNSLVDELATWDSALTSADITTIYNNGVPGDISSYSPLVWYRMGDGTEAGSGTDIYDMSGNSSANAILRNGPTFSTDVPLASQPYNNSNSLLLDGTDDNATLSDTGIGVDSQSAYTFSCWAKFDTVAHNSGIFTVDGGTVINDWTFNNWWRITGSGNVLSWYHSISGTSYKIVSGSLTGAGLSAFATGTWYHIMCTWSGSELKSYVNGTLIATLTGVTEWRGRPGRNFAINVGRNRIAYTDGKIDEWAWIPTDQSSAVADIYNSGVPSDLSSLSPLFYYRMGENDQGTGTTVTNMGSGTGNLTLNNGATFSTDVPT